MKENIIEQKAAALARLQQNLEVREVSLLIQRFKLLVGVV